MQKKTPKKPNTLPTNLISHKLKLVVVKSVQSQYFVNFIM